MANESKATCPFTEDDVLPTLAIQSKTKAKSDQKQERFVGKFHKSSEHEQLGRQKALFQNLSAYLDVCISNDMISRGLNTLLNYRTRCKKTEHRLNVINVELYNTLIGGYAAKGNFDKVRYILTILKEDGIAPNHQTYAFVLECLMRSQIATKSNEEMLRYRRWMHEYSQQAIGEGITLNDIITKSQFVQDQHEVLLSALRLINRQFTPVYQPPSIFYDNSLLNELNMDVKPLSERIATQVSNLQSQTELILLH